MGSGWVLWWAAGSQTQMGSEPNYFLQKMEVEHRRGAGDPSPILPVKSRRAIPQP